MLLGGTSDVMPDVTVEIAFDSGYTTPAASRTWTDVSAYVEAHNPISIQRGRSDELSDVQPSRLTVTLDNKDGRFTPGYTSSPYYPLVKKGRPIRVTAVWPLAGGTTYRRFTGYVDEWPVEWPDPGAALSTVTVTASSRMARLGRNALLQSMVEQEVLADFPLAYYPMGEAAGATSAGNVSAVPHEALTVAQLGAGGTLEFGQGTGPPTDGRTAPVLTRASGSDGKYLQAAIQDSFAAAPEVSIEVWFNPTGTTLPLASLTDAGEANGMSLRIEGGQLVGRFRNGLNFAATTFAAPNIGETNHAVFRLQDSGTDLIPSVLLNGVPVTVTPTSFTSAPLFDFQKLSVGYSPTIFSGFTTPDLFGGTASHVAVYNTPVSDARFQEHYEAGIAGFEGETSDARIERLASYAGVPAAEISAEPGNTASTLFAATNGQAPVQAMLDVAHTENGLLFDAGDGTLTFQARGHRYGAVSVLTLSAATQQLEQGLAPKLDDFGLVNDVTVGRSGGVSVRVVNPASTADHGVYQQSYDLLTTSDSEVSDYANFLANTYGEPGVRIADCSVQLIVQDEATKTALLALELGDLITLTGLPTQAPASSMTFFVEGIGEQIGVTDQGPTWLMSLNLSPGDIPGPVWQLGVSQLGSTTVLAY